MSEATDYPRDVAEIALAHVAGNQVEAAYRRGDLFEKRRVLMEEWASFCALANGQNHVAEPVGTKPERQCTS